MKKETVKATDKVSKKKVKGLPLLGRFLKRSFDVVLSFFGLLVTAPAFAVIYGLIKWEDRGEAIFRQERIGYGGEPFLLYKFRSMKMEAEADGKPQLCAHNDHRMTRIGAFLRKHHLDELPQLWNVLKGDMSFVGYRPERQYFIDQIMAVNPDYALLFAMRPGVFSYATLYNGYTDTMAKMLERLRLDLEYLHHCTFAVDMKIIFLTVVYILSGRKF